MSDDSIGNVTSASISVGAMPCPSTSTVTVGAVRSGNTSTGISIAATPPQTKKTAATASTTRRLSSDQRINASVILGRGLRPRAQPRSLAGAP